MRILFVKLSSMGDILHALAAINDAVACVENLEIDWVVDENFQDIALLHPNVCNVITTNHRKWRKQPHRSRKEIAFFIRELRKKNYDFILDGQTNWKSALITMLAKGLKIGLDRDSVREYVAHFAYDIKHKVSRKQHAVEHLRTFFSKALKYKKPNSCANFGIRIPLHPSISHLPLPQNYYICIHTASWETKLWPEASFIDLIKKMDLPVLLFWGSKKEEKRAERIARKSKNAIVLPKLSLAQITQILAKAKAVVSLDTGLGHLSAALGVPTIGLHGPTDPNRVGSIGPKTHYLTPDISCFPCHKNRCYYKGQCRSSAYCFDQISPDKVLNILNKMLS